MRFAGAICLFAVCAGGTMGVARAQLPDSNIRPVSAMFDAGIRPLVPRPKTPCMPSQVVGSLADRLQALHQQAPMSPGPPPAVANEAELAARTPVGEPVVRLKPAEPQPFEARPSGSGLPAAGRALPGNPLVGEQPTFGVNPLRSSH